MHRLARLAAVLALPLAIVACSDHHPTAPEAPAPAAQPAAAKVPAFAITLQNVNGRVQISWNALASANTYHVSRTVDGVTELVGTTSGTSLQDGKYKLTSYGPDFVTWTVDALYTTTCSPPYVCDPVFVASASAGAHAEPLF